MNLIEINNNVLLNELYDGKEWIHGENYNNINLTIFIITIQGEQLKYALESINKLPTNISVLINVIMNINPTSLAYNNMITRCKTNYFIQLDEDMELFVDAIKNIYDNLKNIKNNCYLHYYYLIDDYLGINNPPVIIGIKVYNHKIMKKYDISKYTNKMLSSVDNLWNKLLSDDGFIKKQFSYPIGYHAKNRNNFDIMLRYCKMIKSLLDPNIKSHRSDKMKIIKPMNNIVNFDDLYKSIVMHFIKLGFDKNKFMINNKILINYINYISPKNLDMYLLPHKYITINPNNNYDYDEKIYNKIFDIKINSEFIKHIYAIIGIINSLFENYEYSYEYYPYEINNYFYKIMQN
jgi:hypothetical protein